MAAADKQSQLEQHIEDWISTYTALSAKGLLERLGVKIADKQLSQQLYNADSFYRQLLKLPAMNAFNELIRTQCVDIQNISKQRLVDYILSGEGEKPPNLPGAELRQEIEKNRLSLIEVSRRFEDLEEQQSKNITETNAHLKEQIAKWNKLIDDITDKTWQMLQQNDVNLDERYKKRLRELFDQQGAGIEPTKEVLKELKIKTKPSPWSKALIQLFSEVENNG